MSRRLDGHPSRTSIERAGAGGSSECSTNLIDGQPWVLQVGEMPHARKKGQLRVQPFGQLYSHLLVDVEIFLAPNHLHGCLELGQLRFEVILVSRKVRVVVGE